MKESLPKRILVIYYSDDKPGNLRLSIQKHLHVLDYSEQPHDIVYYNVFSGPLSEIDDLSQDVPAWIAERPFDVLILHNTLLCLRWAGVYFYKIKRQLDWIRKLDCLKLAIPQDEGDHAALLDEWLFEWGVTVVFSVHQPQGHGPLYPIMGSRAKFYGVLPGYVDDGMASELAHKIIPVSKRSIDIVYRARRLPYWFGKAGQIKYEIGDVVYSYCRKKGLSCDISTEQKDAVLGSDWLKFLASSRGVIGSEGGSNVIDWRGEIRAQIDALLQIQPDLTYDEISARMPQGWDSYRFLTITPRNFEAVITRTCQILVQGEYRGVLEAGKHYIPVKSDFSNLDEALELLKDDSIVEDMVEQAYQDIYLSGKYSYKKFAELIEQAIYESTLSHRMGTRMKQISEKDNTIAALERQLIADRHMQTMLHSQLQISEQHRSKLIQQVRWMKIFVAILVGLFLFAAALFIVWLL